MSAAPTLHAQTLPTDPFPACVVAPDDFLLWFPGGVSVNGVVQPADSVNFPDTPNCSFYQWSAQMFLWLTSPTPSAFAGGRTFNSPTFYDVSRADSAGERVFIANDPVSPPLLNTIHVEQDQANNNMVLMAQNGSLVYYSIAVNDVFAMFRTGLRNRDIQLATPRFPTTQADLDVIMAYAKGKKTLDDSRALTVEIKASWIETTGLDTSKYVVMNGMVPTYDTSNPLHWVRTGSRKAQLAMIGMHVAGSVSHHPEMIWATFEHVDNAPNAAYSYLNAARGISNVGQNTAGSWSLASDGATGPFNVPRQVYIDPNITTAVYARPIGASDTLRQKAFGTASDNVDAPTLNAEVISINNSVMSQLVPGDVRANYRFIGATWTVGGAPPNATNQVGTNKLTNSSMETYRQGHDSSSASGSNCFSCHIGNGTGVSNIFAFLKPLF
jgi:hypothetical protein